MMLKKQTVLSFGIYTLWNCSKKIITDYELPKGINVVYERKKQSK